ncbi:2-hydroxyacid dehydrogenase [Jiella pacifica]|uniref:Phosphoglycerate dehydrogenase n=1 Tax=Jiella pacifica TaxID=2696469 RepID=A0A6N9T9C1_9HYPH|nr:2-hydroxyacid dehydrogenase [Jiella pacifica]MAU95513.1 phosphoglycerate dehydrogenase [Fulvimarina sp.]NDW06825.1 phosphoglycerate dehydrogenase [Jiella pacifica]
MLIVFHGANAETFSIGIEDRLGAGHEVVRVSDALDGDGEREAFEKAEIIVGIALKEHHPTPRALKLYQSPAAGVDQIDVGCLPEGSTLCNAFGHETAIAEYVMAALLARHVPLVRVDAQLRQGNWEHWAGRPTGLRSELRSQTLGIVGFGHIGKAIAKAAKAFGMRVLVANRSVVEPTDVVDESFGLERLGEMAPMVDVLLATLPLTEETRGLIGADVLSALPNGAVIMNVGRGAVIEEHALYDAFASGRISGIIDTWYRYPSVENPEPHPSELPFHELPNLLMTPHMSAWTTGTIARRQEVIVDNVRRISRGELPVNRVYPHG